MFSEHVILKKRFQFWEGVSEDLQTNKTRTNEQKCMSANGRLTVCLILFYFRKRKSANLEQVDAGKISEKDRMLKEKEAEVLYFLL